MNKRYKEGRVGAKIGTIEGARVGVNCSFYYSKTMKRIREMKKKLNDFCFEIFLNGFILCFNRKQ